VRRKRKRRGLTFQNGADCLQERQYLLVLVDHVGGDEDVEALLVLGQEILVLAPQQVRGVKGCFVVDLILH
jgi:hypothetical protein